MAEPDLSLEPEIEKSHWTPDRPPAPPRQKFRKGDKVSMEVSENGFRRRKDFVVENAELSKVNNKWEYNLKTGGRDWEGGKFFSEASLQFER